MTHASSSNSGKPDSNHKQDGLIYSSAKNRDLIEKKHQRLWTVPAGFSLKRDTMEPPSEK